MLPCFAGAHAGEPGVGIVDRVLHQQAHGACLLYTSRLNFQIACQLFTGTDGKYLNAVGVGVAAKADVYKRQVVLDTFVAITAGLIIFPACFTYGVDQTSGPSLIFITPVSYTHLLPGSLHRGAKLHQVFLWPQIRPAPAGGHLYWP